MKRGFQIVSKYKNDNLILPYRATEQSAGYDISSAVDMTIPSIWKKNFVKVLWAIRHEHSLNQNDLAKAKEILKPYLIPTGIKAYMQSNEVLIIANRSSNPLKRGLALPNGIGVIDADYYNNSNNEGELFVQIINLGLTDYKVAKGDRIGQGIFMPYLTADNEVKPGQRRTGGFGSSGQ